MPEFDHKTNCITSKKLLYPRVCPSIRVRTQGQALLVLRRLMSPSMSQRRAPNS